MLETDDRRLSNVKPFAWSQQTVNSPKCIFSQELVDNKFEAEFARFLDKAHDVARFTKLPLNIGFSLPYTIRDGVANRQSIAIGHRDTLANSVRNCDRAANTEPDFHANTNHCRHATRHSDGDDLAHGRAPAKSGLLTPLLPNCRSSAGSASAA